MKAAEDSTYKNKLKEKKKQKRRERREKKKHEPKTQVKQQKKDIHAEAKKIIEEEGIKIEYVDPTDEKLKGEFKEIIDKFYVPKKSDRPVEESSSEEEEELIDSNQPRKKEKTLTKKQLRNAKRMKISELKMHIDKPEIVEAWDVTAKDPLLLLSLKRQKNTVPVPKHWNQKRKFLQNKRGFLKPPLELPEFIDETGISKIRDNTKLNTKSLKAKMKERMQPKLGRMDIDYQTLHDAFFKYQRKPYLTSHGDIYYENKENTMKMSKYKPGRISENLRNALGMSEGSAPPWIINMQRYGPPPTYPNLKIPGVNAPLCDPTADVTPNLWKEPPHVNSGELIYRKNPESNHWGDLEQEEDELSDIDEDVSIDSKEDFNIETFNTGAFDKGPEMLTDTAEQREEDFTQENQGRSEENSTQQGLIPSQAAFTHLRPVEREIKSNEIFGSKTVYEADIEDDIDDEIEMREKELKKAKKSSKLREKF